MITTAACTGDWPQPDPGSSRYNPLIWLKMGLVAIGDCPL